MKVKSIVLRNKSGDDVLYIGSEEIINDTGCSIHINYEEDEKEHDMKVRTEIIDAIKQMLKGLEGSVYWYNRFCKQLEQLKSLDSEIKISEGGVED